VPLAFGLGRFGASRVFFRIGRLRLALPSSGRGGLLGAGGKNHPKNDDKCDQEVTHNLERRASLYYPMLREGRVGGEGVRSFTI
jgi:hypothetical protein